MPTPSAHVSNGARLVTPDGRLLPLLSTELRVDACAGVARILLLQRFRNAFAEPLEVSYLLPLPADGAVSGFAFTVDDERIVGRIDRRASAREQYEEAIAEGRTAALLEQDRSSVFQQLVGNVPPNAEVVVEVTVDQPLVWFAEGAWEWRFPTVVAPRYLGEGGRVADAKRVSVDVVEQGLPARSTLQLLVRDSLSPEGRPQSPSHVLGVRADGEGVHVGWGDDSGEPLDRDVVVRWPVARAVPGLELDCARPAPEHPLSQSMFGILTIVPPAARGAAVPRDVIVLIDTSGSMQGAPLEQAKRVTTALIDGLTDTDRLELIEFGSAPRRFARGAEAATAKRRAEATRWVQALKAGGSTEMRAAIVEALQQLRAGAQRQVLLITDGLIGFEQEIVREVLHRLPKSSRLHTLGVGHGVNRSLLGPAARAGNGAETIVAPEEDVEPLVRRVLSRMEIPVVVELEVTGSAVLETASVRLPDLFGGCPTRVPVRLQPGGGTIWVRGKGPNGPFEQVVVVGELPTGRGSAAVTTLFGRERAEDLEMRRAAGEQLDAELERVGLEFRIATRLTSWVAVSESVRVDPKRPTRHVQQPHSLPHGMSAGGLGLRPPSMAAPRSLPFGGLAPAPPPGPSAPRPAAPAQAPLKQRKTAAPPEAMPAIRAPQRWGLGGVLDRATEWFGGRAEKAEGTAPAPAETAVSAEQHAGFGEAPVLERGLDLEMPDMPPPIMEPIGVLRVLSGRVRVYAAEHIILEGSVEGEPLDWALPESVSVELADGTVCELRVDAARSTLGGSLLPGQTLRLCLFSSGASVQRGSVRRVTLGSLAIAVIAD